MASQTLSEFKQSLPIFKDKEKIMSMIDRNLVSIIQAETGSGKSTQIPQFIIEKDENARIAVAQPRRMPAIAVASRVAEELGVRLGDKVGYHIKGECKTSDRSQIIYMTSGMMIQIISHVGIEDEVPWDYVIMDEVHERSIEIDFLLVIFKYFLAKGKIFKLILMSATMQPILADYFSISNISGLRDKHFCLKGEDDDFFIDWSAGSEDWKTDPKAGKKDKFSEMLKGSDSLEVFSTVTRKYPISIYYIQDILQYVNDKSVLDYIEKNENEAKIISSRDIDSIFQYQKDINPEEIDYLLFNVSSRLILYYLLNSPFTEKDTFLVFLPGIQEINQMTESLQNLLINDFDKLDVIMLHSSIPENEHKKVLKPPKPNTKRVILSTNIAESSITLPDVSFVIDFCCCREIFFSQKTMTENLVLVWAAKATMKQRAGRTGRVAHGTAFRLIPSGFFREMKEYPIPEMQRTCLDKIILKLKLMDFNYPRKILQESIQPPSNDQIEASELFLKEMGAVDEYGKISRLGRIYVDMPFDIRVTRLCVFGIMFHCANSAILCAAIVASDKQPISNLSNLRVSESIKHPESYQKRLQFAKDSGSDLIMCMNVFKLWYEKFGKTVEQELYRHGHRHLRAVRPSIEERRFCGRNFIESGGLREILGNVLEIKKKLIEIGVDPVYFKEKWGEETLKVCIGAAFCDRVLVSQYEILDERSRNREIDMLGNSTSVYLSKHQNVIDQNDIRQLLYLCIEKPVEIKLMGSIFTIDFGRNVNEKTLKMALWLGNYTKKYINLAWIVMKEEKAGKKHTVRPNPAITSRVPGDYRREGSYYTVNDGGRKVEINYIKRLEYPYKLSYRDLITGYSVKIEEDSVNFITFSTDQAKASSYSIVCSEYFERGKNFIGKNATLLPVNNFLPYIIVITFAPNVYYVPSVDHCRYAGFCIPPNTVTEFKFLFTQQDAEKINEIRERVSNFALNRDYFQDSGLSVEVYSEIMKLANSERVDISQSYPNWLEIIDYEIKPAEKIEEIYNFGGFLPPIPLLELSQDLSCVANDLKKIQEKKLEYLESLHRNAKISDIQEAYVVCGECNQIITEVKKLKIISRNPLYFSVKVAYGSLVQVNVPFENEVVCFIKENFIVNNYEMCNSGHVVGWSDSEDCYLFGPAKLRVLLPMLRYEELTDENVENNFQRIFDLKKEYLREMSCLKIDRTCKLCKEKFETDSLFIRHVQLNEKHLAREEEFKKIYIV